jgi:hypothetical protein
MYAIGEGKRKIDLDPNLDFQSFFCFFFGFKCCRQLAGAMTTVVSRATQRENEDKTSRMISRRDVSDFTSGVKRWTNPGQSKSVSVTG